jgi:hypothetical protein
LRAIKAAFADAMRLNRTMTAASGADDLGMDEHAIRFVQHANDLRREQRA